MSTTENGNIGEQEVIDYVPCPNCGQQMMRLPTGFVMYDVQCTNCIFRAQIKTSGSKPRNIIFGSTWNVTEKVLKAGYIVPPLFVNFKWTEGSKQHQEIRFYPFVPKKNLRPRTLPQTAKRSGLKMFDYTGLSQLPHFVLYKK